MKEDIVQRLKKIYPSFVRIGLLYVLFSFTSFLSWATLRSHFFEKYILDFWTQKLYFQAAFVCSLLIFFSLASVFLLNHPTMKADFYSYCEMKKSSRGLIFLLKTPIFWMESIALLVFALLFSALPPLSFYQNGFLGSMTDNRWLYSALGILILWIVYFCASLSTVSWWGRPHQKKQVSKGTLRPLLVQLGYTVPAWILSGFLLSALVPLFSGVFILFYKFWWIFLILFVSLFLAVTAVRYLSVFFSRHRFLKQFYKACRKNGYSYSAIGSPCLELIFSKQRFEITVQCGGETYRCRFIGGLQRKNPLYLREDGIVEYAKFRILWSHVVLDSYEITAENNEQKLLIVCPCNGKIFVKDSIGERRLEGGDRAYGYTVHTPEDFLGALGRKGI